MKTKTCPDCNGDGVVNKGADDELQCPTCGGCGFVPDDDDDDEEVIRSGARAKNEVVEQGGRHREPEQFRTLEVCC